MPRGHTLKAARSSHGAVRLPMRLMPGPQPVTTLDVGMAKSALQSGSQGGLGASSSRQP